MARKTEPSDIVGEELKLLEISLTQEREREREREREGGRGRGRRTPLGQEEASGAGRREALSPPGSICNALSFAAATTMTTTKGNFRRARDDGALNEQRSRVKLVSRRTRDPSRSSSSTSARPQFSSPRRSATVAL